MIRAAVLSAALVLALPAVAAAEAWRAIEFRAGITDGCSMSDIAVGPDGNLWFAEYANGAVGRITPGGQVTEIPVSDGTHAFPSGITTGPDGRLWVVLRSGAVVRLGLDGARTTFTEGITGFSTPPGTRSIPTGITAGPDGNIWFAEPDGAVGRITPDGQVTEFREGVSQVDGSELGSVIDVAAGPDGNIWYTHVLGRIGRITPDGQVTEFGAGMSPQAIPTGIAAGPDGNLWFTELYGDRIGRITPDGRITEFSAGLTPGAGPSAIAPGPDGAMWFTERAGRIGRIIPAGRITEFTDGITPGADPSGIVMGPDRALWFTTFDRVGRMAPVAEAVPASPSPPARPVVRRDRVPPRVRIVRLRGTRATLVASEPATLTARRGATRLRIRVRAGRSVVVVPAWVPGAVSGGMRVRAVDRAGNAAPVTLAGV
ncbi:MAG: hypothetical protein MUE51_04570 [Thermoleophilia bacterium]|nr:hypothetical protein [Thermoleophilia bacterium]